MEKWSMWIDQAAIICVDPLGEKMAFETRNLLNETCYFATA